MAQSRLEKIEATIKELEARRKNLLAGARKVDRKEHSRRKFLIGHLMLANCEQPGDEGEKSRAIVRRLVAQLERPADRELFAELSEIVSAAAKLDATDLLDPSAVRLAQ